MADAMELKRDTAGDTLVGSLMKFFMSSVGSKVMMAATGLGLSLFIVAHLLGNLTSFFGREVTSSTSSNRPKRKSVSTS